MGEHDDDEEDDDDDEAGIVMGMGAVVVELLPDPDVGSN